MPKPARVPKVITICGSSRFIEIMAVCAWLLETREAAITMSLHYLPRWYRNVTADHMAEAEGVSEDMDELHLKKITISDEIFVVNPGGYIGESTSKEIEFAGKSGRRIRYYTQSPYMAIVNEMLGADRYGS